MDNEIDSDESKKCLCPQDQAMQYYMNFGRQRNLEKFLRLPHHVHSPCSFSNFEEQQPHCSTALPMQQLPSEMADNGEVETKSKNQDIVETVTPVKEEKLLEVAKIKSPTKSTQTDKAEKRSASVEPKTLTSTSSSDETHSATLIRIFKKSIEADLSSKHTKIKIRTRDDKGSNKHLAEKAETDDDNFRTPKHSQRRNERREQMNTPESATRSHRRLEWDSMADIGYRRSKSSSNISVLERLVLNKLLQDGATDQERKQLERLLQPKDGQMMRAKSLDSPPLASSTHLAYSPMGEEQLSSSPEQREKSIQTTLSSCKKKSQRVEVDLSSTTSSDNKSKSSEEKLDSLEKLLEKAVQVSAINKISSDSESSLEKSKTEKLHNSPKTQISTSSENSVENSGLKKASSPEYDLVPAASLLESISTDSFQLIKKPNLPKVPEAVKNQEKISIEKATNSSKVMEKKLEDKLPNFSYERSKSLDEGTSKAYMFKKTDQSRSFEETNVQLEDIISSITDKNSTREEQEKAFRKFQKTLEKQLKYNNTISSSSETTQSRPRSRQSAQLELGIKLLCELIEARTLSKSEKEKLLSDVVRRICSITGTEPKNEILAVTHDAHVMAAAPQATSLSGKTSKEEQDNISKNPFEHSSPPSTSAAATACAKLALPAKETHPNMPKDYNEGNARHMKQIEISHATVKSDKQMITTEISKTHKHKNQPRIKSGKESVPSKSSTSTDVSAEMSNNNKNKNDSNNSDKDVEVWRKPSWLQPMTHSEFEYEHRQAAFAINAENRQAILHQPNLSDLSTGKRSVLVNWLDMEINRLERLRQVMVNARSVQSKSTLSSKTTTSTEHLMKISAFEPIKENAENNKPKSASSTSISTEELIEMSRYENSEEIVASSEHANANKVNKRRPKQHEQREQRQLQQRETERNIELVIEESKENKRMEKSKSSDDKIKYTQPAVKLGTLRERNSSNSKTKIPSAEKSSYSTTSSRAPENVPVVQQRSKMATPSSSIQSYSMSSIEEKRKEIHTMATQTTGGAEQGTQTRPLQPSCQCIHTDMGYNNYNYPYHACEHQRRRNMFGWYCCPTYACNHNGMATYYTTPVAQGDNYRRQPTIVTTLIATTTTTTSKTTQAGFGADRKSAATQINAHSSSSSGSLITYTKHTSASQQQKPQEKSASSSSSSALIATLPDAISSSEVSIPMGSNVNGSSSTTTTTHQYDDLDSVGRQPSRHDMAAQTSSTLLLQQIPEEVAPGLQSAPLRMKPKSIAYVLEFSTNNGRRTSWTYKSNVTVEAEAEEEQQTEETEMPRQGMTLQAHLEQARPTFVAHAKQRKALLNKLQLLRQQREEKLREIIENSSFNSIEGKLSQIPPPAIDQVRVFSTVQMKALTRKRARKLPEVLDREHREREERRRRGNRLLRDLFNRRLQKRVRIGQLSLNHSRTVI